MNMQGIRWLSKHVETIYIRDAERCCATCAHYYPHYVRDALGRYIPVSMGHCIYPRTKARRAQSVCEHYAAKEDGRTKP
jgi:hypothetical protein